MWWVVGWLGPRDGALVGEMGRWCDWSQGGGLVYGGGGVIGAKW